MGTVRNAGQVINSDKYFRAKRLTPVVRRCRSEPGRITVALGALIILRCKDRKACHSLVDFGPDREAKTEEERIDESIAKTNSA